MEIFSNLLLGFEVAISPTNLFYCLLGVTVGTLIGVLPGIGPLATISMLLPITFGLDPIGALIMLAGIYYGAQFGSSTTSILLNIPGTAASAVVCLDGYPMARQGKAATALVITTIASFVGGTLANLLIVAFAPPLATFALRFGPAEYFAMLLLGLVAASGLGQGSFLKGIAMVLLGIIIGMVGVDVNSGIRRFTFGNPNLADGIDFVIMAMALFAIAEIAISLERTGGGSLAQKRFTWRELIPSRADLKASVAPILRGFGVGSGLGILPGAGPTVASFIAYSVEKRIAKDPSRFGKGAIEGVASPEAANNAAASTGFIPTLTLGVPGDAVMALMLGALLMYGITPGPRVIIDHPDLFWGLIVSMWIGNLFLLVLNIPFIGLWVRVLSIPYHLLYPSVLLFVAIGTFSLSNNSFDILLLAIFGLVGYILTKLDLPAAPLLLGLILGPLIEENVRRALLISRGDPTTFITRPISASLLAIALCLVLAMLISEARRARAARLEAARESKGRSETNI